MSYERAAVGDATSTMELIATAPAAPAAPPTEGQACSSGSVRWLIPSTVNPQQQCDPLRVSYRTHDPAIWTDAQGRQAHCCPDAAREAARLEELAARQTRAEWVREGIDSGIATWTRLLSGRTESMDGLLLLYLGGGSAGAAVAGAAVSGEGQRGRGALISIATAAGVTTFGSALRSLIFGSPFSGPRIESNARFLVAPSVGALVAYLLRKKGA